MQLYGFIYLLSSQIFWFYANGEIYDITTIYRLNEYDSSPSSEMIIRQGCINVDSFEIHARTNALAASLYVPTQQEERSADLVRESGIKLSPECGSCGWTLENWLEKSQEFVTSEPTLIATEQVSNGCKYDAVQVDTGYGGGPAGVQGRLESPRGETKESWTLRSMKDQRIKVVLGDHGEGRRSESAELQSFELEDFSVRLEQSEGPARSDRYEEANLTADYLLSRQNYLRLHVRKNVQKSFSAIYFFESQDQATLYGASGALTSGWVVPWADRLCIALLARSTRARGTVLDVVAHLFNGESVHLGRWNNVQENTWTYLRFVRDINIEYTDKEMKIIIIAAQEEGATIYIRKIEECDPDEIQSTKVVKKDVFLPTEFTRKSEEITTFSKELNGKCINGGKFSKESGHCICPPGFAGMFCSEGCGPNKYGDDCGGKCSSFRRGCQGLVMCKHEVGCDCAPGFHGPLCRLGCAAGEYGFGCRQRCGKCQGGVACDPFTGVCPTGCLAGYFGELCLYKYTYLSTAPVVYTHGPHDLEVVFKKDLTQGRGLPRFYKIQYKRQVDKEWISRRTHKLQDGADTVTANVTGLGTWTYYDVRVVLVDIDLNSYEGDDLPYTTVRTSCVVPEEVEYYIHSADVRENSFQIAWVYEQKVDWCPLKYFEVYLKDSWRWVVYTRTSEQAANFTDLLAGKRHRAKVRAITVQGPTKFSKSVVVITSDQVPEMVLNLHQSSAKGHAIELKWKKPRFTAGEIRYYVVTYKCKQLVACASVDCSHSAGQMKVDTTHTVIVDLIPHAQYYVTVSAVSGSQGPAAIYFPATDYTAPDIAPELSGQYVSNRTDRSFTVHWQMPENCTGLNGFLTGYYCELLEDSHRVIFRGHTENKQASFEGLRPSTQYLVKVYYVTTGGWSRIHPLAIHVKTKSSEEHEASTTPAWEYLPPEEEARQTTPSTIESHTLPATTTTTYSWEESPTTQEEEEAAHRSAGSDEGGSEDSEGLDIKFSGEYGGSKEDGETKQSGSLEEEKDSIYNSEENEGHGDDDPLQISLQEESAENGGDYSFFSEGADKNSFYSDTTTVVPASTTEGSIWW